MYQSSSSSSSSSQKSSFLVRYGPAGDPLFNFNDAAARSTDRNRSGCSLVGHYYSGEYSDQSINKVSSSNGPQEVEAVPSPSLLTHRSSPYGSFSQLSDDINAATGFGMGSWWGNSNCISFASPQSKRAPTTATSNDHTDALTCSLNGVETQFSMSHKAAGDWLQLHNPEDSVPCKIRAKRGFATHPRSIAERERRTRISGKLKKLQELVPNMDKQSSYADMLDLAVDHIKGLQKEVQKLEEDLKNCTCGSKGR